MEACDELTVNISAIKKIVNLLKEIPDAREIVNDLQDKLYWKIPGSRNISWEDKSRVDLLLRTYKNNVVYINEDCDYLVDFVKNSGYFMYITHLKDAWDKNGISGRYEIYVGEVDVYAVNAKGRAFVEGMIEEFWRDE